ncbi:MAG: Ig-like domain repeat protein [Nocardioides sp.]|uniref:Ig-like domain repeat protein n=1 Tax=Nocardioides sp. TaxID=35761 RepID=UPI003265FDA2
MSVRRLITGATTASIVAASVAILAPAHADPTFVPVASDLVGVGSDTSMHALGYLADGNGGVAGYNATHTTGRLASFDAGPTGTIVLREGSAPVSRVTYNGSGNGKKALYGASNNPDVDFARSSSALNATEVSNNLQAFPFAKDTLAMATATTSNAPASLTKAQVVSIYKGEFTNWSQVGGAAGVIAPKIPQSGSGTRDFFIAQLTAANGGVAFTPAGAEVQEHDDAPIKADPNAIAPFSVGRAGLLGTLRIEAGEFVASRALYNVVRQADVANADVLSVFGPTGFACSPAAASLILDAGFEQLLSVAQGGECGKVTQAATANLATAKVATTTAVVGTSAVAGAATLTATIAGGGASKPQGTVDFFLDGATTKVATSIVTGGKATKDLTGLAAGGHTVVAKFVPASGSAFNASDSASAAFNVIAATPVPAAKASTKLVEKFKASYAKAASYKGKVIVKESSTSAPTGKIVVKRGKKVVGKGAIKAGKVTLKLKKLKKGKNKLTATYAGDSKFNASKLKFKITVK